MAEERRFQWQPFIELIVVLATVVGTTVPLYVHTDGKIHEVLREMKEDRKEWDQKYLELLEKSYAKEKTP